MKLVTLILASAMFFAAACDDNPDSGSNPDGGTDPDGGSIGEACTTANDCSAEFPICTAAGNCVGCETSSDCSAEAPVCSNGACTASCAGTEVAADVVTGPSDIIWIVDQSSSMSEETAHVQAKINDFAALISASNIDYRVVMIATPTTNGTNLPICVPPPLGGASCGNNTRFRLVDVAVGSHDGPQLAISRYNTYKDFLRPEATKHFVFVTDDNSGISATQFTTMVQALQPAGMFDDFRVHGIYAFGTPGSGCNGPFGSGAGNGTIYTQLIAQTSGASGVICTGDWTQVFQDISAAVVSGSQVPCEFELPEPPMGQTLDTGKVNVKYEMGGVAPGQTLPQVPAAADCPSSGAWYYDDNTTPTRILLCPTTCTSVQNDPDANVKVELGCSTQIL